MPAAADHDLDQGPRDRGPFSSEPRERLCIATRVKRPVGELIRFVVDPSGAVVPDLKAKLPGRGVWVDGTAEAVALALARKAFARGFKRPVQVDPGLVPQVEQLLERAALDALSMVHKSGLLAIGFTKAEAAALRGTAKALVHASDAAPDGVRKLAGAVRSGRGGGPEAETIRPFTSLQLDLALGRPHVIHAALLAGPASETFLVRCRRLERFRTEGPGAVLRHRVVPISREATET